jgi:hypothetical protein
MSPIQACPWGSRLCCSAHPSPENAQLLITAPTQAGRGRYQETVLTKHLAVLSIPFVAAFIDPSHLSIMKLNTIFISINLEETTTQRKYH